MVRTQSALTATEKKSRSHEKRQHIEVEKGFAYSGACLGQPRFVSSSSRIPI
jgi:hypothetical protein